MYRVEVNLCGFGCVAAVCDLFTRANGEMGPIGFKRRASSRAYEKVNVN